MAYNKYILLDVLVYNIAVYFDTFCSILTSPQGESKCKERVKIYSDIQGSRLAVSRYPWDTRFQIWILDIIGLVSRKDTKKNIENINEKPKY